VKERLETALRELARSGAGLVIAHGGQNNAAAQQVAGEFPAVRFVVTQGNVKGANLSSYEVLQEQSAYLAGALAALTTRTGVVGHMSGIRVTPGLKGRAAFAAGVAATDPKVRLLTNFSGNQDDNALSRRIALAQMDAGADVIFTMLNAGRQGVTDACLERRTRQIGNVVDWTARQPAVFVGSAVANVSKAVFAAVQDHAQGRWQPGVVRQIGLEDPEAVRLTLSADVAAPVRERLDRLRDAVARGEVRVPDRYDGPEFSV
jgi:basic membrane protein A